MHSHTRQNLIIKILEKSKFIKTSELLKQMEMQGIPAITARRDLKRLEEGNYIKLIHGAIMLISKKTEVDIIPSDETQNNYNHKLIVASKASALIGENTNIFISSGEIGQFLVKEINQEIETLITDDFNVFKTSVNNKNFKKRFLTGGWYNEKDGCFTGHEQELFAFSYHTMFICASRIFQRQVECSEIIFDLFDANREICPNKVLIIDNNRLENVINTKKDNPKTIALTDFDYIVATDLALSVLSTLLPADHKITLI